MYKELYLNKYVKIYIYTSTKVIIYNLSNLRYMRHLSPSLKADIKNNRGERVFTIMVHEACSVLTQYQNSVYSSNIVVYSSLAQWWNLLMSNRFLISCVSCPKTSP